MKSHTKGGAMRAYVTTFFLISIPACVTPTEVAEEAFSHYSKKGHGQYENKKDFVENPVKADTRSLNNGKILFNKYCVTCHGEKGEGNGIRAKELMRRPADLARLNSTKSDYAIYLQISYGNEDMPNWIKNLTVQDRWDIVNHVRSLAK